MYGFPVAIQLFGLRREMEADFEGSMRKVKEMGYDGVEFAGLFGRTADQVKKLCDELELVPISAHVQYGDMLADENLIKSYAEIGCKHIIIPFLQADKQPGTPGFEEFKKDAERFANEAHKYGMKLGYHNHDFEFNDYNGEHLIDIMYREIPAEILETQFDTCWVNVGGEDPAEYLRKYAGRVDTIHLKDFARDSGIELRILGHGVQDIKGILDAAKESGTEWVIIEQDDPSEGFTPLECSEKNIQYMKAIN